MNPHSSIEFELADSQDSNSPAESGVPPADPTAFAPKGITPESGVPADAQDVEFPADKAAAGSSDSTDRQQPSNAAESGDEGLRSDSAATERPFADKPLLADEHNTVISNQPGSHEEPVPVYPQATAEELQARLFEARDNSDPDRQPLRIGRMEVFEKIGAGGMGAVFRAVDTELSREVALKVLHPRVASDPALVSRFRNEARACAQLNHDNIARVYYADEYQGVQYIAYEYAAGRTIKELIHERGQLTTPEVINYAIQATLALGHIESAGIIHRDIKPSNIILTDNGRIKVVDLGLARRETEDSIADLTVAGTTLGTFDYLAPEQARDARAADIRSDIYSLGCSVYHMLTGCAPYPDGNAVQKMLDHQGKDPPDVRQKNKSVPRAVAGVVQRMMMTQPDQRYQAPGQLLADLIHLAGQMGLRSVPAEGIVWRRVPVTKVRDISGSLFLTGAVAVICVTALLMHFVPGASDSADAMTDLQWLNPTGASSNDEERSTETVETSDETPDNAVDDEATDSTNAVADDSESAASQTTQEDQTETPAAIRKDVFLVRRAGEVVEQFESLAEAWDEARDGDAIELDFDGPAPVATTALPRRQVQGAPRIALRSARGRQPVISLAVGENSSQDRFFELSGNVQLQISGVHFQVDLANMVGEDGWSLFDFRGANSVQIRNCTIQADNGAPATFSIFRMKDAGPVEALSTEAEVVLSNVAVRGTCDLLRLQSQLNGTLSADECGFVLDGCLVNNVGSEEMRSQGRYGISLDHCTTLTSEPVVLMRDSEIIGDGPSEHVLSNVKFVSRECVFGFLEPEGTLVSLQGNLYEDDLQEHLSWDGENNVYHRFLVYLQTLSGLGDGEATNLDFQQWRERWNRRADTQETSAREFENLFQSTSFLNADSVSVQSFEVGDFELESSLFSTTTSGRFQRIPGASIYTLPEFPESP